MGTTTCTNCGRHTAARAPTCRHCGFDPYEDRRAGRVEDYDFDRVMRRVRNVLYVIFLPVVGLLGQFLLGALLLLPFFFAAALASGAGGDGPVQLMRGLTGFVFAWPGYLITVGFTLIGLYRRFQRVRTLTHRLSRSIVQPIRRS
ncbi:MAG: hypothetical protein OXG65_00575 [Chloroflexi bacterium]|nr:hypothetical protein [Chloroflexota bacterium]